MRGRIALAVFFLIPALLLGDRLHSWAWFFAVLMAEVVLLLCWITLNGTYARKVTPQELADELERHLVGNEGSHDWDDTTSFKIADERLNRLIPKLLEFDRLDTDEKRKQLGEIIEVLRRGEIPD